MTDIREDIVTAYATRLGAIATGSGYRTTIDTVERGYRDPSLVGAAERPYIGIVVMDESCQDEPGRVVTLMRIALACYVRLLCAECAKKDQKKRFAVDEAGEHVDRYGHKSDQIGWLIPAVPTDDMDTYWGYTTVPEVGCVWWDMLPVVEMCEEESSIKPSTGQK